MSIECKFFCSTKVFYNQAFLIIKWLYTLNEQIYQLEFLTILFLLSFLSVTI